MPELPEVETIRQGLQKYLVGHKILDVEINVPKIFQGDVNKVIGATVKNIQRAGKGIVIELNNDYVLAVHLKLTGQLIYRGQETKYLSLSPKSGGTLPSKYTHVIFKLDKNAFLFYNDLRQFGWIKVLKKDEIKGLPFFKELGPEPLKDLALPLFREIVSKSNLPIKILIMDQKKIAGIGNIYANEALFDACIDPRRKAKTLHKEETEKLYNSILKVLKKGLKYGGSSDVAYVNALGQDGKYQEHFLVYGKKDKPCPRGNGIIQKITLGGRGTFFCPKCQK